MLTPIGVIRRQRHAHIIELIVESLFNAGRAFRVCFDVLLHQTYGVGDWYPARAGGADGTGAPVVVVAIDT